MKETIPLSVEIELSYDHRSRRSNVNARGSGRFGSAHAHYNAEIAKDCRLARNHIDSRLPPTRPVYIMNCIVFLSNVP